MKKFTFRLETLLKVRIMEEEEAQIKFGQANHMFMKEKEKEFSLLQVQHKLIDDFRTRQSEGLTIETLKNFHNYIDKVKGDLFLQSQRVQQASEYRDQCLKFLEDAVKNRKLVEKLKEKQWQEYQTALLSEEQKFLDELGVQAFNKDIR